MSATHQNSGEFIFQQDCHSAQEIGQYLMKLCLKYYWFVFFSDTVYKFGAL